MGHRFLGVLGGGLGTWASEADRSDDIEDAANDLASAADEFDDAGRDWGRRLRSLEALLGEAGMNRRTQTVHGLSSVNGVFGLEG